MKKILLITLLLSGCSSRSIKLIPVPNYQRLSAIKTDIALHAQSFEAKNESEELAKDYLKAKKAEGQSNQGKNDEACRIFTKLSGNLAFSLNQAALVHTLTTCSFTSAQLQDVWKSTTIATH